MAKRKYDDREYRFMTIAAARGVPYATAVELFQALELRVPPPATYRKLGAVRRVGGPSTRSSRSARAPPRVAPFARRKAHSRRR